MSDLPSISAPPIGAASAGLRYQIRYFWRNALPMLYDTRVLKVVVEHRGINAVDDVVVYYAAPGINDGGTRIDVDFTQVKFHVAETGSVDHDSIVDPTWTSTKLSMLRRFRDAWLGLRDEHPAARLTLVTNWPWNSSSPMRPLLRDGGRIDHAFLTKGARSKIGKIRNKWQIECELEDKDFHAFVKALRISTSAVSQSEAEEWLRDRCQLAGLMVIDPSLDWSPYDDLGRRMIESGRTEHTPDSFRRLVKEQGLVHEAAPPFRSTLAIRSFTRFAHMPEGDGASVVDLTDLFEGRLARRDDIWSTEIPTRFELATAAVENLPPPVHLALDAHLSIAWYAGSRFNTKSGIPLVLRQRTKNRPIQLWDVSAGHRPEGAPEWVVEYEKLGDGPDLAVVVSVTHDALEDARRTIAGLVSVGALMHLRLPAGGPASIVDGGHARWLADGLVRVVQVEVARLRPSRVHIFPAAPVSLMFLVGQDAAALGPTTVYEFDFGNANRAYRPGMSTDQA